MKKKTRIFYTPINWIEAYLEGILSTYLEGILTWRWIGDVPNLEIGCLVWLPASFALSMFFYAGREVGRNRTKESCVWFIWILVFFAWCGMNSGFLTWFFWAGTH
jgi:hypothetical protein